MNTIPLTEAKPNRRGIHAIVEHLFYLSWNQRLINLMQNTLRITTGWWIGWISKHMVWIEIIPLWMAFEDATKPSSKQPFAKHTKKSEAFDTLFLGCMDEWRSSQEPNSKREQIIPFWMASLFSMKTRPNMLLAKYTKLCSINKIQCGGLRNM